jgi:arginyl-tRNA synthetase
VIGEIDKILVKRKDISDSEKGSIAQMVGVGAVKYSFLKNNPLQDTKFDIKESVSIDGNSGPYLQYTFARCKSVLGKSSKGVKPKSSKEEKLNPEETSLLRSIYHFPEAVSKAAKDYTPNTICEYLYLLAQKYNSFYNKHKIIGSENESLRLLLTRSSSQVIKNGLTLLGIATPDRM